MHRPITLLLYISSVSLVISSSVNRADYGEIKLFQRPETYSVEATVLLNEAERRDKEVSYKVKAALAVHPVWTDGDAEFLLRLELISPQLYSRGKHPNAEYMPHSSIWDSYANSIFYLHWKHGIIQTAYLEPDELLDVKNFKRSLISLFQFQVVDGEANETDISGNCKVTYETAAMQIIRKFKSECVSPEWAVDEERSEVESRRVMRYTLSEALDSLDDVYGEELHTLGDPHAGVQLKARAWLHLRRAPPAAPPPALAPAPSLAAALAALPPALAVVPLAAPPPAQLQNLYDPPSDAEEIREALQEAAALRQAEAGGGGRLRDARAALRLHAALRRPSPAALAALADQLHDGADPHLLDAACAALGQAPGDDTHALARRYLRLRAEDGEVAAGPARAYLAALALAPRPPAAALAAAARLADGAHVLAEAGALAAAHATHQIAPNPAADLARCKDDECRRIRLLALGNLRRADTADLLLEHAAAPALAPALAALDALANLPLAVLQRYERARRLEQLALEPRPLEVRAAALDLLLRASAFAPFALPSTLAVLRHQPAPPALRRLARARLLALAPDHAPMRELLRMLPPELRGWDELAAGGASTVIGREVGAAGGWRALLESVQLERGGALRRGLVRLSAVSPTGHQSDVLAVELWTRGLEALAGGAGDQGAEAEETSGGLAFSVGGVRLPGVTLFAGQGELLGHVWAGTGSEPTPALRAQRALGGAGAALVLLGGVPLLFRREAALALALDAQAQVSLWSRSARTSLMLRAGLAVTGRARVAAAWGELRAEVTLGAEPRLRVAADIDFYDGVSLCVRVSTTDWARAHNVTLQSELGGVGGRRVRRERVQRWAAAGRTLSLGAPNDATCRSLGAADEA